jgi:mannose-6-phosphate isomerase-like protein (cupin superfamily)
MLRDSLKVEQTPDRTSLHLDDLFIAVYSLTRTNLHPGKIIELMEAYAFPGYLALNDGFFHRFQIPKHAKSKSQMQNIAKGFFEYEGKNHACLVQYLHPDGHSSEHYHTLDEIIIQLAGKTSVSMRPIEEGEGSTVELTPGGILVIPPKTWHRVETYSEGSITVPIKQTIKGRKDHFYEVKD